MNNQKNAIALLFILTFLFLRIVNAHAFSHFSGDEDQVHCELCEIIAVSAELTPCIGQEIPETKPKSFYNDKQYKINFGYKPTQYIITLPKSIYNKPPPVIRNYFN